MGAAVAVAVAAAAAAAVAAVAAAAAVAVAAAAAVASMCLMQCSTSQQPCIVKLTPVKSCKRCFLKTIGG